MLLVCSKLKFCGFIYYQKSPPKKCSQWGRKQESHRLIFNKDQLKNEGAHHTNHLMSANSFPGPKRKKKKPSCFLLCRPNMAKHQGNSEWNQLHLLLTEFSFILILPRAGYSAASNYNEELLSNGFQIAPWWGINWKGQFKSLGHVNAFLILSDWEISGCKRLKCLELIKT